MPAAAVVFLLLGIGYTVLMDFYRRGWNQIPPFIPGTRLPSTRVSVVIALRNEEGRVNSLLQALAGQDLPRNLMEILMVDDCSEDQTAVQIETLARQYQLPVTLIRMQEQIAPTDQTVAFKKKSYCRRGGPCKWHADRYHRCRLPIRPPMALHTGALL